MAKSKQETNSMLFNLKKKNKIKRSSLFVFIADNPDKIQLNLLAAS